MRTVSKMESVTCLPIQYATLMELSEIKMPICVTHQKHLWEKINFILRKSKRNCPIKCITYEFTGKRKSLIGYVSNPKFVWIDHYFLSEYIQVYQEYLVYDIDGMIGSIGGTLGLFIGLSFLSIFNEFINVCKNYFIPKQIK